MKTIIIAVLAFSAFAAHAGTSINKFKCSSIKRENLTATAEGKITLVDTEQGGTNGSMELTKIQLLANGGKTKGSLFENLQLQALEDDAGYDNDALHGNFLPIVDHKTINRISFMGAAGVKMVSTMTTNRGNEYQMKCEIVK